MGRHLVLPALTLTRLPLLILLAAFLGSGLAQTVAIISLLFWPTTARAIRAQVQSVRQRSYVKIARNFGGGAGYVLRRHILPAIAPLIALGWWPPRGGRWRWKRAWPSWA